MKKFNLRRWEYDGNKLAHPLTIIRRSIAMPFVFVFRSLLFIAVLAGWGMSEAKDTWNNIS